MDRKLAAAVSIICKKGMMELLSQVPAFTRETRDAPGSIFGLAQTLSPSSGSSSAAAARSAWKPAAEGGWKRSTVLSVSRTRKAQGLRPRLFGGGSGFAQGIEQEWTISHGLPGLVDAPLLCPETRMLDLRMMAYGSLKLASGKDHLQRVQFNCP